MKTISHRNILKGGEKNLESKSAAFTGIYHWRCYLRIILSIHGAGEQNIDLGAVAGAAGWLTNIHSNPFHFRG